MIVLGAAAAVLDAMRAFELVTGAIALLILALGALSLINIQLVAMRQRICEIGVRRAFGATSARVFFSVLLESLVATVIVGAVAGFIPALVALRVKVVDAIRF